MESCKSQNNTLQHKLVSTTQIDFDKLSGLIFQCYGYQSKHHDLLQDELDEKNDYFYVTTVHCESAHGNGLVRKLSLHLVQKKWDTPKAQNSYNTQATLNPKANIESALSLLVLCVLGFQFLPYPIKLLTDPFIFSKTINITTSLIIEDVMIVHLSHDALIEDELRIKWTIGGSHKRECRMLRLTLRLDQSGYTEVSNSETAA